MIELLKYIKIQIKRAGKLYPSIIIFTLIIAMSLSFFLINMLEKDSKKESENRAKIGIVGDMEDAYLNIGLTAVKDLDASKEYIDFVPMEKEAAKEKLEKNEIVGYLYFPDNFIQDAIKGKDTKLQFYLSDSPASLGPIMMEEVISVVSRMVIQSQNGTYGFSAAARKYSVKEYVIDLQSNLLSINYAQKIIQRKNAYNVNVLGIEDGLPAEDYYFCAILIVILLLCGIVCAQLLVKADMSFSRLLYSKGQRPILQLIGEYLPFAIMMSINFLVMITGVGYMFSHKADTLGIMSDLGNVTDYVIFGCKLLPVVLLITMFQFLIYELATGIISGVLLQMLTTIGLVFLSGFIFPLSTLPEIMQEISKFLPTGIAFDYVRNIASNADVTSSLFAIFIDFAVLLAICTFIRRTKIRGAIS